MKEDNARDSNHSVREVYLRAQALPEGQERESYLEEVSATHPDLAKDVRSLLGTEVDSETFLHDDIAGKAMEELDDQTGTVIDKYRILEKLGEGGFGEVFRVEQTEPIHRELALKLIKPGMDSREIISRFESERQALALLDHPNIASIHDAGTTESGHPYFVMELAVGEPITRYCDTHQLPIPRRLQLFQEVCSAVQHAHQKGILHRDLKPSNIVVVEQDGDPMPKIIDFGITKSLQSKLTDHTVVSRRAVFLGTPAYMSPEQLDLSSENLDTRTDVYALGVVLYELLAGDRPFDQETLDQASFPEIHRVIREVEPPRPSTRVHTLGGTRETVARQRLTEPLTLERTLRGDLDWIVMKAIDKDRDRRYQGAALLSQDISRYLEHKPVEASPPSIVYLARKFVRRHRLGVSAAGLIFLALVSGLTLATVSYQREARQRFLAEESRSRSQELLSYIQSEVQPKLDAAGRRDANIELAKATIRHYEGLPPELYDHSAMREHAMAYKQLQRATQWNFPNSLKRPLNDADRINNTMSAPLWRQVADADPNDVEAEVEAYMKERRSGRYAKIAAGEWKGATPKQHVTETLRTLRELEKQYPDSKEVQFYLIRVGRAEPLGLEERKDSVERAERLIDRYPEDDRFHSEHLASVLMLAYEYRSIRQVEQALATLWKGWNTVEAYLKEQPSHWGYLTAARYFGSDLLKHVSNEKQVARLASSARDFAERLRILDPSEPYWHWQAGRFTCHLAVAAWLDCRPDEAYSLWEEALKCLKEVAPQYWDQGMDADRINYHLLAGMSAAATDDRETAHRHLHTLEIEERFIDDERAMKEAIRRAKDGN